MSQRYFELFYFERILERISKSKYKNHIILKGGLLLTSIIGNDNRTTKDMDTSLKGYPLNKKQVEKIFKELFSINLNDGVSFEIISIKEIRLEKPSNGYRLNILSTFQNNRTYITVEITAEDVITPREIKYNYKCFFQDKCIPIMSYNIETILAEKLHAIMYHGLLTTRLKDFYDMYALMENQNIIYDKKILTRAIQNTFNSRNTKLDIAEFKNILEELNGDSHMKKLWKEYQTKNHYAQNITYQDTINAIEKAVNILENELKSV